MTVSYEARGENRPGGSGLLRTQTGIFAFDGRRESGGTLPGPAHFLASALAASILKNVERFSHMLEIPYEEATITVTLEHEEQPPRIASARYELTVYSDESARRASLLYRITKFGTIVNTLGRACELTGTLTLIRSDGSSVLVYDPDDPIRDF